MEQPTQIWGHSTRLDQDGSTTGTEWPRGGARALAQRAIRAGSRQDGVLIDGREIAHVRIVVRGQRM